MKKLFYTSALFNGILSQNFKEDSTQFKKFQRNFSKSKRLWCLRELNKTLVTDSAEVLIMKKPQNGQIQSKDAGADKVWFQPVLVKSLDKRCRIFKNKNRKRKVGNVKNAFSGMYLKGKDLKGEI